MNELILGVVGQLNDLMGSVSIEALLDPKLNQIYKSIHEDVVQMGVI